MNQARLLFAAIVAACVMAGPTLAASTAETVTAAEYRRGEEQTFLTYPEWFLVHSPAELATYLGAKKPPSGFPWGGHIRQFWQGYRAVTDETAEYPFNAGYHLMVSVIGGSTTVEYALRAAYEATLGRLSEAVAGGADNAEDRFAAEVAQRYVDFIRVDPWYLFDFMAPLQRLWALQPLTQDSAVRRWERRFLLSTEWLLKAGYAWLIKQATGAIYDEAKPVTAVLLSGAPQPLASGLTPPQPLSPSNTALVSVSRYRAFMFYAQALAAQGLDFLEIAGNRGPILVSVLQTTGAPAAAGKARAVLVQPILSQPGRERVLVALPVGELAAQLRRWHDLQTQVEHIYDY